MGDLLFEATRVGGAQSIQWRAASISKNCRKFRRSPCAARAIIPTALQACGGQMTSFCVNPLLERQRVFGSRDTDKVRAFLHSKEFRFDFSHRQAKQLDLRINGVYLPDLYIGYIQYGAPAEVRTNPAHDGYWLQFPIQERIEITVARECIVCGPERAAVSSPTRG